LRCRLRSADRLSDSAISRGLRFRKTLGSRARAWLVSVTLFDHRRAGREAALRRRLALVRPLAAIFRLERLGLIPGRRLGWKFLPGCPHLIAPLHVRCQDLGGQESRGGGGPSLGGTGAAGLARRAVGTRPSGQARSSASVRDVPTKVAVGLAARLAILSDRVCPRRPAGQPRSPAVRFPHAASSSRRPGREAA
jgi:hypothetical protein